MSVHNVARFADLREDRGMQVEIGEQKIVLLRIGEQVRAYQGECPHAGAPLADGAICNGRLICPWHKAMFDVDDGSLCEPPALNHLTRFPAQVVNGQVQVDDQPLAEQKPASQPHDPRCFVIVGAGAAGTAAACALREKGFSGRVVMIDREIEPGYDRTVLSKFVIAGDMSPDETPALREPDFYREQHIERVQGEVIELNPGEQRVTLGDGRDFHYDAALLATGGEPHQLSLPGAHLPQVVLLRSREHAQRLLDAAPANGRAVIIGASFIGLEAASALRKRGMEVTVLARHEVPFESQFGTRIGQAIRALHEQNGVLFRTHVDAVAFEGDGHLQAVVLNTAERLPADLVLAGTGVSPMTAYVQGVPRADNGSLRVDAGMQLAEHLWAAGDITTFPLAGNDVHIEHWRLAQQHARVAAQNMLGAGLGYADVPFFWTYHFDMNFDYLGYAEQWDDITYIGAPEQYTFIALLSQGNNVAAVVACQYERAVALLAERMKQPLTVEEARALIETASAETA